MPFPFDAEIDCQKCERFVAFRRENQAKLPDGFNGAVPSFGDPDAPLLIVGLAPGLMGANRTGRPFTGDWAGDLLYQVLAENGLSSGVYDKRNDDGLTLLGVLITNAVRCVPPQNKPVAAEINQCRPYLVETLEGLPNLRAIFTLGRISHESTVKALGLRLKDVPFGHGHRTDVRFGTRDLAVVSSYHCSRYNTNTGRLTALMFDDALKLAKKAAGLGV